MSLVVVRRGRIDGGREALRLEILQVVPLCIIVHHALQTSTLHLRDSIRIHNSYQQTSGGLQDSQANLPPLIVSPQTQ
jgi:hypothetical protein